MHIFQFVTVWRKDTQKEMSFKCRKITEEMAIAGSSEVN